MMTIESPVIYYYLQSIPLVAITVHIFAHFAVSLYFLNCSLLPAGALVAQRLALRAYSRMTTMVIPKSRSCEERDGRGFKPLLEHLSFFFEQLINSWYRLKVICGYLFVHRSL